MGKKLRWAKELNQHRPLLLSLPKTSDSNLDLFESCQD